MSQRKASRRSWLIVAADHEVFVRVDLATRWADVRAAVSRDLKGIMLPSPDDGTDVAELDAFILRSKKSAVSSLAQQKLC